MFQKIVKQICAIIKLHIWNVESKYKQRSIRGLETIMKAIAMIWTRSQSQN